MTRLPCETKADVTKSTPATQSAAASPATKTAPNAHQSQPSAISARPATRKVPRRQRRPKPPQARHQSQPSAICATSATQNAGGCHQVPRLPRETTVLVAKCHACHAKCRGVTGDQNRPKRATRFNPVPYMPCVPRKTQVDAGGKMVGDKGTKLCVKDGV